MTRIMATANFYQQFDADYSLDVPGEGYGGWRRGEVPLNPERTAVVVMHAWDCGTYEQFPGQWRAVEYIPRSYEICRAVLPGLLAAVRASRMGLYHVVGGGDYYRDEPGYREARARVALASPPPDQVEADEVYNELRQFRATHVSVGPRNRDDVNRCCKIRNFPAEAKPLGNEGVAENADQLLALCKRDGVNHLVYAGFAINWCLLVSPGGMHDMSQRGVICSALRQAVTAVENKETAREELCKQIGLWRVALAYGFVFDVPDFLKALEACPAAG